MTPADPSHRALVSATPAFRSFANVAAMPHSSRPSPFRHLNISRRVARWLARQGRPFDLRAGLDLDRTTLEDEFRSRHQAVYVGDGIVLARVLGRFKMYLRGDDVGFAGHVMMDGYWESWLTRFLIGRVEPGMVCVDVGANFGYHTLALAHLCGPAGRVVAVEPNPMALEWLRRTMHLNGFRRRTRIEGVALGDTPTGSLRLVWPAGEPKNARVIKGKVSPPHLQSTTVPVTSLDRLLAEEDRVDFLKIDAEGAEVAILRGGLDTLRTHRPHLVLEYNPGRYEDAQALLGELLDIYGAVARLDITGDVLPIAPRVAYEDRSGEDQLLYFGRP
ncbi:FkbM family methyltransferase [Lutibaculum baratangense]|uniref:Methyltransferase FkbM n=1 Tax=Lutibaculum baratangense AMV1 TaxID=631454 RepID=V4RH69_9HYPH|nr:FkbM family methyltransferase [Lutibaculum baratangense]ESR22630.1 methyltransferase FkbM [Lutibaculum baratangense AMV1]